MNTLHIDVKKILQQKNPFLTRIPFFVAWLKKIVHEKELNEFLNVYGYLQGIAFIKAALEFLNVQVEVTFTGSLAREKRYVFVANHPLGGLDGIALIKTIGDIFPKIRFPVNDILLSIQNLDTIFMPINKHGNQNREAVNNLNEVYASQDQQVLMFPAGLVSREIKGKIVDLSWQKHFIKKAVEYKRDVVPVYIDGKNSNRFYRIAKWRKYVGLPNIEMLFLPDELFRQKNQTIKIIIGETIPYDSLKNHSSEQGADLVKKTVYELAY